jgi:DNA mismatch endonuclease (patch repair protein)
MPKTRPEFWISKFNTNVARDRRHLIAMDALGWRTLVIWECDTENPALLERLLMRALSDQSSGCTRIAI